MYKIKNQINLIKTISQHQQVFSSLLNEANTINLIVTLHQHPLLMKIFFLYLGPLKDPMNCVASIIKVI